MNENNSYNFMIFQSTLMIFSLTAAMIIIGIPVWAIGIVNAFLVFGFLVPVLNIFILYIYHIVARPTLYTWALVIAIQGKQDVFAIAFYIIFGIQAIFIIKNFFSYLILLFASFSN